MLPEAIRGLRGPHCLQGAEKSVVFAGEVSVFPEAGLLRGATDSELSDSAGFPKEK